MENERWFRVPRGGGVREIEKMEEGESPYYYTNSHYGVITGSGSSSSSQSHGMISMSMPPPPSTLMVSSSYAAAAAADHDQTHYYYFGSSQLPFTNMINPTADHETSHSQKEEYDEMRMKAKVMAHPLFPRLLASYLNCQKINEFKAKLQVGAPAEVVVRLEHAASSAAAINSNSKGSSESTEVDPELDQFMEAYCEMLAKYHEELTKPFHDAMLGLSQINSHLNTLSCTSFSPSPASTGNLVGQMGTSEEAQRTRYADPRAAEDLDIKAKLLKKYGGCLGSLSQELKEKKKTGKLPKEARAKLQEWWSRHYTWPYPSEPQKLWLAASTGLTVKQINNWFINQRKRHWKPSSEGIQLAMADHHHPRQLYYMDHLLCNPTPLPMDCTSTPLL